MSDVERIIREVDSSMKMEGMLLTNDDKDRIRECLSDPSSVELVIDRLLEKHTVPLEKWNNKKM